MADWFTHTKEILDAVFNEYAVRLGVFFLSWPLFHLVLQLPLFRFLSALNIPVTNESSIQALFLISAAGALFLQKWIYGFLVWLEKRKKTQEVNKEIIGDIEQNEATFLLLLFQERISVIRRDFRFMPMFKGMINQLVGKDGILYDRSMKKLATTYFMYYDDGLNVRGGPYYGLHLDRIERNGDALR